MESLKVVTRDNIFIEFRLEVHKLLSAFMESLRSDELSE